MPKYAIVDSDNIVKNVIIWDEASPWSPPDGHTIVKAEDVLCDIGWKHENGVFTEPPKDTPAQTE